MGTFNLTHASRGEAPSGPMSEPMDDNESLLSSDTDLLPPLISISSSPFSPSPTFDYLTTQQTVPGQFISDTGLPATGLDPTLPGLRLRSG
jgi:hypothetical protein